MKVIIIGAGTAGLTCAIGCRRAGMEVILVDQAKELKNIGGGLLLWPHGLRYLDWLGIGEEIRQYYVKVTGCSVISSSGEEIFNEPYAELYSKLSGEILPIDRSQLQQALLRCLPQDFLQLNKQCVNVQHYPDYVEVAFADGTTLSADLVIGADGIHSRVRQTLYPSAELLYTGHYWWGGIISQKDLSLSAECVTMLMSVGKMAIIWPTYQNKFMWYLPVKMPLQTSPTALPNLTTVAENWHPIIDEIIQSPPTAQNFHLPIYAVEPLSTTVFDRVVLIGDASHGLGPVLGQGASKAIEDAYALVSCLQHSRQPLQETLAYFARLTKNKNSIINELENQSAAMMINDDLHSLQSFESQIQHLNLVTIYQDLIPLVNDQACINLAKACEQVSVLQVA
ncbi:MAG: FAD-dependent monooxygenase [Gammaproteobacteria bacterium]|nr:FAD-dependent monooxygenase [Gammaproteobacteria bacterium]